jgi:hypothetical protein
MKRILVTALAAAIVSGARPVAHHSYSGYSPHPIEIEGTLERFERVNPHAFLKVRAADGVLYMGEWVNVRRLEQYGIGPDALRAGDRLVLTGLPRLDIAESGLITVRGIRRVSDGWTWEPHTGVQTGPAAIAR